jgi:hypothetical protein
MTGNNLMIAVVRMAGILVTHTDVCRLLCPVRILRNPSAARKIIPGLTCNTVEGLHGGGWERNEVNSTKDA